MINNKYKVRKADDCEQCDGEWLVEHSYTTNYEDADYSGAEDRRVMLFSGSLSDCKAYLDLYLDGRI